jgi:hypothetical protein
MLKLATTRWPKEDAREGDGRDPVNHRGHLGSAEQIHDVLRPRLLGEQDRRSGQDQDHHGNRQNPVGKPPTNAEPPEVDLRRMLGIDAITLALPALAPLAIDPQQHVRPEEQRKTATIRNSMKRAAIHISG